MNPSPGQRRLGDALRALRRRARLSGEALGLDLGMGQKQVSRIELGQSRITPGELAAWLDAAGATDEDRAEISDLFGRAARELRSWREVLDSGVPERQREVGRRESRAGRVDNFQLVIPGLLQTADYASNVFRAADTTGGNDIPARVAARVERQRILYDPSRDFNYVLPESALLWKFGDLREQGDRLISLDSLPNVSIAVLPFDSDPPVIPGAFTLYDIPGEPVVEVELLTDVVTLTGSAEVAAYRSAFGRLRAASVQGDSAHALIRAATRD
jgi:transcriptional regulator with XRE-family HTH domain